MGSTEAEQGHTGVDVLPVVVGVSDAQRALVFAAVVVAVTDQACLEMIVEVGVAVQRS
jgi:propanediol utilization protein